jgi:hypothetical protein
MVEIILLAIFVTNLFILDEIKKYVLDQKSKEKEKDSILRKGLM